MIWVRSGANQALAIASAPGDTGGMAQNFDLGEFIKEQRRTAQISVRQLAKLAGVSNPYLSQIERGLRRPSAEIMQQIAKGLRISAEALYVQAGILDERIAGGVVVDAVIADPTITERQKQVMLEVYDSFRKENRRRDADEAAAAAAVRKAAAAEAAAPATPVTLTVVKTENDPVRPAAPPLTLAKSDTPKRESSPDAAKPGSRNSGPALRTTMSRGTNPRRPR
jgi:transcriptional regulator with XRE-family HTH domain